MNWEEKCCFYQRLISYKRLVNSLIWILHHYSFLPVCLRIRSWPSSMESQIKRCGLGICGLVKSDTSSLPEPGRVRRPVASRNYCGHWTLTLPVSRWYSGNLGRFQPRSSRRSSNPRPGAWQAPGFLYLGIMTNMAMWTERARQAQSRIFRKPRKVRQAFIESKGDFERIARRLGQKRKASHPADYEDAHIMDIDGCGRW